MSNLSSIINDNQTALKGAAFHYKFYAILMFVTAGLMIISGLPAILLFGLGFIYIGIGVLYIFLGIFIFNASKNINSIINVPELTQDDYNTNSIKAIIETKKFFKAMNIMFIVTMGLLVLSVIVFAAFLPAIMGGLGNSKVLDNSYNSLSNPYSQSNQTAAQMGMSDKDHAMMADHKNIQNTDYDSLDYPTETEIKTAQENAMKLMTPEQKAAMSKLMQETTK